MSNRARRRRPPDVISRRSDRRPTISLRDAGKIKKYTPYVPCGRMHRNIAGSAAFEYPVDARVPARPRLWIRGGLLCDSHASAAIQYGSARDLRWSCTCGRGFPSSRKIEEKRRRNLVIDGSKGPHRKIVDAHPWRRDRSRTDSYVVVSTRRKTGMDLATSTASFVG